MCVRACVRTCLSSIGVPSVVAIGALRIPHQKETSDLVSSSEGGGSRPLRTILSFSAKKFSRCGFLLLFLLLGFHPHDREVRISIRMSINQARLAVTTDGSGSDHGTPPANTSPLHSRIFIQNGLFREPKKRKRKRKKKICS